MTLYDKSDSKYTEMTLAGVDLLKTVNFLDNKNSKKLHK